MEKECLHCKKIYKIQRIDSIYCSRSCRQMAYMVRKTVKSKTISSNEILNNGNQITTKIQPEKSITEKPNFIKTEQKYINHDSMFLQKIRLETVDNDKLLALNKCIKTHQDIHSYWIGQRLRCLIECLLLFSEANLTPVTDLMELCYAFTCVRKSIHYQSMNELFPYKSEIEKLNHKLKTLCLKCKKNEQIKFRMQNKDKIELIVVRYELAQFFRKEKFSQLNFE